MSHNLIDGEVSFDVPAAGKPCTTHYRISGDLKSGKTPLVVLHGGPGCTHDYLLNLVTLTSSHGIPLVFYDQLGNGQSTHLPDKNGDTSFWTIQLFISELENLLRHLGIQDNFDLLGHSWGGMLASSFAVTKPKGLRRLILASSIGRMKDWVAAGLRLQKHLPQDVQDTITKHEAEGTTSSKEYEEAIGVFYSKFLCRIEFPEILLKTFVWMGKDPTVYGTMNGPSEFHVTGPLKDFDITGDLHKITVPTLVTHGHFDGAQYEVVSPFFNNISAKVRWVTFAESSHMPHLEEEERYLGILGDFLQGDL
ncbi:Alpha/Beta hydrolase protein [Cristinia sonorae]|uniref:Alpha/Beta hydrolase protein n=1 Tax=Cristinia sonorae TaxID=1940300 RepID=A0A8K0UP35_9AGAR|nr:Alpha/Beta hydrolase protein [Cristinia sonorae]